MTPAQHTHTPRLRRAGAAALLLGLAACQAPPESDPMPQDPPPAVTERDPYDVLLRASGDRSASTESALRYSTPSGILPPTSFSPNEVATYGGGTPSAWSADARGFDPDTVALNRKVSEVRLPSLVVDGVSSLRELMQGISQISGLPIHVQLEAEEAVADAGIEYHFNIERAIRVRSALELIREGAGDGIVGWKVRDGVILWTTADKAKGDLVLRFHNISHLTMLITDRPGPTLDMGHQMFDLGEGNGAYGGVGESVQAYNEDDIESLITDSIDPDSWVAPGVSIRANRDILIVRATPEIQDRITKLLRQL